MQCSLGCQQLGDACPSVSFNYTSNTCYVGMLVEPIVKGSEGEGQAVLVDVNSPVIKGFLSMLKSLSVTNCLITHFLIHQISWLFL